MAEQTTQYSSGNKLFRFFVRLQNPVMKWLLRSPLHGLVSGKYVLITVTGPKAAGSTATLVQYGRDNGQLFIITSRDYMVAQPVRRRGGCIVLRGAATTGWAAVETRPEVVEVAARVIYPVLKDAQLARFLPQSVAVVIQPGGAQ